tara:strand:+ start:154 stop:411 length:258 start_codon:yes stop_codon:yes gene_type:complete
MAAAEAAKSKKKGGRGRGLTDEEKAALMGGAGLGGFGTSGSTLGFGAIGAAKVAEMLKDRRDERYGKGSSSPREITGGNPYGYSS